MIKARPGESLGGLFFAPHAFQVLGVKKISFDSVNISVL